MMSKKRFLMRPSASLAMVFFLPFSLLLGGCKKTDAADDAEKTVVAVETVHPAVGAMHEEIAADAVLAPLAQAAIQSKVTAPIKAFYVQRGSRVKAGQLLAQLESKDLAAAALDNKGTYTAAQGAYTTATKQQVPQEETQARLDLEQAKATLDLDQSILNARTQLLRQGAIPGRDVDTAKSTLLQAQAAFQLAQQRYDFIKNVGHEASLATASGQLDSAKGKYLNAEAQLGYTEIRTPIAGVVTDRPLFVGETATAGTSVVTVMDTSALLAKVHLAQRQAQELAVGGEALVAVPGIDEPVKATIALISPAVDPGSTTIEVWLRVENRDGRLKAGTAVRVMISGRVIANALQVPVDAVQRSSESGGKMVMVIAADGTAHKKNITVGVQTAESVQVVDGLSASDNVITTGGFGLDDGTKVKVEAAKSKPDAGDKE